MDWDLTFKIIGFVLSLLGMGITMVKYMEKQFRAVVSELQTMKLEQQTALATIKAESTAHFHTLDTKLHGLDITVGPYGPDILELKRQSNDLNVKYTELSMQMPSVSDRLAKVERQVETLYNRPRN